MSVNQVWYLSKPSLTFEQACLAESRNNMRTRSLNTEILFCLSSSNNISDSLNKFGGQESDTAFLVASVDQGLGQAREVIVGDWAEDLTSLPSLTDRQLLTKLHKLKPPELTDLEGSLCSRIAAKDCL